MKYNKDTKMWESKYWHPALTTDAVVFGFDKNETTLNILLVKRGKAKPGETPAFEGCWALPGGFLQKDETTDECVLRELSEETYVKLFDKEDGIEPVFKEQLKTFSKRDRDPREFVVTVAYYALVKKNAYRIHGGDDAVEAKWFSIDNLPQNLAFDHSEIIDLAISTLREKVHFSPICFDLLDETFTLAELKSVYDIILGTVLDRGNFRSKMIRLAYIKPTGKKDNGHPYRSANFYTFDKEKYLQEKQKDRLLIF